MSKFKNLTVGQTFAFLNPSIFSANKRFAKMSDNHYQQVENGLLCGDIKTIGTNQAQVTKVKTEAIVMPTPPVSDAAYVRA